MRLLEQLLWLWQEGGVTCLFHMFTGLYCPGCGGTRALKALLLGHPVLSFLYHPLIPYCAAMAVWFFGSHLLYRITGKPRYRVVFPPAGIYAGIVVILVNFIVKNYFLIRRGIDILEQLPKL